MRVRLVSTDRVVWEGEATSVVVPAELGELGILPGRQPLLTLLRQGVVRVSDGREHTFNVISGFVSVDGDDVEIVVDQDTSEN